MPYTESDYENAIIDLFQNNLNYDYLYAPNVERDFRSPLYDDILEESIRRINKGVPYDAIKDALFKLRNFENGELVQKNAVFMDYLQNGIQARYTEKGEERAALVYLIDYENVKAEGLNGIEELTKEDVVHIFVHVNDAQVSLRDLFATRHDDPKTCGGDVCDVPEVEYEPTDQSAELIDALLQHLVGMRIHPTCHLDHRGAVIRMRNDNFHALSPYLPIRTIRLLGAKVMLSRTVGPSSIALSKVYTTLCHSMPSGMMGSSKVRSSQCVLTPQYMKQSSLAPWSNAVSANIKPKVWNGRVASNSQAL